MNKPLRILHLEDDPDYSDLVKSLLTAEGLTAEISLVGSKTEFEAALAAPFDLILADYQLPDYDGLRALRRAREVCPEVPFLLVSGAIGEQLAIESLKCGATDYVLKRWVERLVPAVRRAVREARERAQRLRAEAELVRRERYFRTLTEHSVDIVTILDREGRYVFNSPSVTRVLGYDPTMLRGKSTFELIHSDDLPLIQRVFSESLKRPDSFGVIEGRFRHRDGSWRYLEGVGQNRLQDPDIGGVVVNSRDITERKRAEESLRESEAQYRLIFDGNPTPMWVFDHETLAFLEVNDAALQHYGYSRDEFLRMTMRDIRPDDDLPAMVEYFHRLQVVNPPAKLCLAGVWRHRKKDGGLIDVELKWSPISFKGRWASLIMVNDITERKRIEHRDAALAKLGQRLSCATSPLEAARIIKTVAEDLFQWEVFTLNLYSSERDKLCPLLAVKTDGQGRRIEIPTSGEELDPSATARRAIEEGAQLTQCHQPPAGAPQDATAAGDLSPGSASLLYAPIRNRTKVIGLLSIHSHLAKAYDRRDLDSLQTLADHCGGALERIRAEQALHESEMLFHSVWQSSVDGMRLTDGEGRILFANDAFCRLVGMSREKFEGMLFTVVHASADENEAILDQYRRSFRERTIETQVERKLVRQDGTVVTLEETTSFVGLEGRTPLMLGLFRDVSQQRRLEDQLRQSQKMEAIGQLAGGVAHDFNNILTVIHGHASLLYAGGGLPPVPARSAQQIVQAVERAAALTRQLLAFSRRQVMQLRNLDLNDVVANMTKMLGRILGEDVSLQFHFLPQPALVRADGGMMEQVLLNLVVNARDAMPKGGTLTVGLSLHDLDERFGPNSEGRPGHFVCIEVVDTGCGIPPENLRRVFEPFFTTKEMGKGTGLGLATVYGIVRQHQGWVEVDSQVGKGSRFRVFLPRCAAPAESATVPNQAEPMIRGGTETILVVEDEAPVRELVCQFLSGLGYVILQATSGSEALRVWREHKERVDLLLTDLVMPGRINGRELAEQLWVDRPPLKVIFTSGYSAEVVGRDFTLCKGLNYLQKPYTPKKLASTVRDCLDGLSS